MKVTFYSNFFNHHQEAISLEFVKRGIDYTFVATEPVPEERLKFGYEDANKKYDFILTTYESKENYNKAIELADTSDIVIVGSAPNEFIEKRINDNKITFRYSERIYKRGRLKLRNLKSIVIGRLKNRKLKNKKVYLLCASAYAAKDYLIYGAFKDKCYKWGYFPEKVTYDIDELLTKKDSEKIKIIWVARFLDWKHPEYAVDLAQELIKKSYKNFEIIMLGNGELLEVINQRVREKNLEDYVKILGAVPSYEVRKYMEESNIHIFTSDKGEGWGAVLNESMNSACAVVANYNIGSVPYLIKNGANGLWYKTKKEFIDKVIMLMADNELRKKVSVNAYKTIEQIWNPENAVDNLLKLCENLLLDNEKNIIKNGPCSKEEECL